MKEPTPDETQHLPSHKKVESLLLTTEEMGAVYDQLNAEGRDTESEPLELKIKSKTDKQLEYLGVHHSNDPHRPDLDFLRARWQQFLAETEGKDRVLLVEGGVRHGMADETSALTSGSETGLFSFLGEREGVEIISPEPDRSQEILELSGKHGRDETVYYYFIRMAAQWQRTKSDEGFTDYLTRCLEWIKELSGWTDYDFSMEHMGALYTQRHGQPLNPSTTIPHGDYSPFGNPLSKSSGLIRDKFMVGEIAKLWSEGKSIFVVYGNGHLITQENALKEILK